VRTGVRPTRGGIVSVLHTQCRLSSLFDERKMGHRTRHRKNTCKTCGHDTCKRTGRSDAKTSSNNNDEPYPASWHQALWSTICRNVLGVILVIVFVLKTIDYCRHPDLLAAATVHLHLLGSPVAFWLTSGLVAAITVVSAVLALLAVLNDPLL
jgi:hypothetical protein